MKGIPVRFHVRGVALALLVMAAPVLEVAAQASGAPGSAPSPSAAAPPGAAQPAPAAAPPAGAAAPPAPMAAPAASPQAALPLPDGFRGINLGMGIDAVKAALKADPLFNYQGDPAVSMLPSPNENLIETSGYSYVTRAFFQFYDKNLFTIILMLDPTELSYYTMYTTLEKKYGPPSSLSPDEVVWESKQVRLSLERPLSVKYIDLEVFDKIKAAGQAKASERTVSRDQFLSQF